MDRPRSVLYQKYLKLCHAMQSGVATMIGCDKTKNMEPKHLRVGINCALVEHSALAELLMSKGIFTEREYVEAITEGMAEEVKRYEDALSKMLNKNITLG